MKKVKSENNFTKGNQNGITLIALIVTIIVLIIIAGISIATLTADNGVLRQTNLAKVQQMEANAREQVNLACAAMRVAIAEAHAQDNSYSAIANAGLIQTKLKELIMADTVQLDKDSWATSDLDTDAGTFNIIYDGDDYKQVCNDTSASITFEITLGQKSIEITNEISATLKDQNGNNVEIDIGAGSTEEGGSGSGGSQTPTESDLATVASIGQYVNYDPTTGGNVTDENTTYTSQTGSISVSGNGSGNQTFSASNYKENGGKWQILDIKDGTITLISDLIYQDSGTKMGTSGLKLSGALGYLWAEKELHTICSIYGHGKGADTSQTITYYYGGPSDQDGSIATGTVEAQQGRKATMDLDSGARSLTMNDLDKICGTEGTYTANYSSSTVNRTTTNGKYYPTLNTTNKTTGISTVQSSASGSFYKTFRQYGSGISSANSTYATIQNDMVNLAGTSYWLAFRGLYPFSTYAVMYAVGIHKDFTGSSLAPFNLATDRNLYMSYYGIPFPCSCNIRKRNKNK